MGMHDIQHAARGSAAIFSAAAPLIALLVCLIALAACSASPPNGAQGDSDGSSQEASVNIDYGNVHEIYFAGGCFWGIEEYFSRIPGVADVQVGYANGTTEDPSYEQVCTGTTGYAETARIAYDPSIVSLETLTRQFFKVIDPTSVNRQHNDVGSQYRTGVYYTDEADLPVLQEVFDEVQSGYDAPLATELQPLATFALAEDYHQDYLRKNPNGYCPIDFSTLDNVKLERGEDGGTCAVDDSGQMCGTPAADGNAVTEGDPAGVSVDASRYSKPSDQELRSALSDVQYRVTQQAGTEAPYTGAYLKTDDPGLYVDVATGEPLFSSDDKYDAGTGWPAFTKPIAPEVIVTSQDTSHGMVRTEVRSRVGNSHLGHVFNDGPAGAGGLHYCIDSAALRFIPYAEMDDQGYSAFKEACSAHGE